MEGFDSRHWLGITAATEHFTAMLVRQTFAPWREYLRHDFHPDQQDSAASQRWLLENQHRYTPVSA